MLIASYISGSSNVGAFILVGIGSHFYKPFVNLHKLLLLFLKHRPYGHMGLFPRAMSMENLPLTP